MEVGIRLGVIEAWRNGALPVVELTANVARQSICRGDYEDEENHRTQD